MYLILKTTFQKEEPKILICRDFKKVTYADFQPELNLNLSEPNSSNSYEYCTFDKSFVEVLDKHAPKKRKFLRDNHKPHVNKTLRSTFMQSTQLKIKAMKPRSKNDVIEYKRQHNLVVKLKKRCKKRFLTILKQKINLNRFGQLLSHISPMNMQRVMQIFSLLKIIKFYLVIVK